jgi:hypothetical protein
MRGQPQQNARLSVVPNGARHPSPDLSPATAARRAGYGSLAAARDDKQPGARSILACFHLGARRHRRVADEGLVTKSDCAKMTECRARSQSS